MSSIGFSVHFWFDFSARQIQALRIIKGKLQFTRWFFGSNTWKVAGLLFPGKNHVREDQRSTWNFEVQWYGICFVFFLCKIRCLKMVAPNFCCYRNDAYISAIYLFLETMHKYLLLGSIVFFVLCVLCPHDSPGG